MALRSFGGADAGAEAGVDGALLLFFLVDDADADDGFCFLLLPLLPAVGEDTEHV